MEFNMFSHCLVPSPHTLHWGCSEPAGQAWRRWFECGRWLVELRPGGPADSTRRLTLGKQNTVTRSRSQGYPSHQVIKLPVLRPQPRTLPTHGFSRPISVVSISILISADLSMSNMFSYCKYAVSAGQQVNVVISNCPPAAAFCCVTLVYCMCTLHCTV